MSRDIIDKLSFVGALNIVNSGDATLNGLSIDKNSHGWPHVLSFLARVGVATGAPTSFTVICKIQDSADNTAWADVSAIATKTILADDTEVKIDVDVQKYRRYTRIVCTILFVAGTVPTIPIASMCVAGEKRNI